MQQRLGNTNSSSASKSVNDLSGTSPEVHATRPRGIWIPIDIWNMVLEGRMTATELHLHLVIDSLVDAKGLGCFASNEYLADTIKTTIRWVEKVKKKWRGKTLFVVGHTTNRGKKMPVWETMWSRVKPVSEQGYTELEFGATTELSFGQCIKKNNSRAASQRATCGKTGKDMGPFEDNPKSNGQVPDPFFMNLAKKHKDAIIAIHPRMVHKPRIEYWVQWFVKLEKALNGNRDRLVKVHNWYLRQLKEGNAFAHQAYCGKSFYQKFDAIEASMNRSVRMAKECGGADKKKNLDRYVP